MTHDEPQAADDRVDPELARRLAGEPAPVADPAFRERMRRRFLEGVATAPERTPRPAGTRAWRGYALAAAVVLALSGAWLWTRPRPAELTLLSADVTVRVGTHERAVTTGATLAWSAASRLATDQQAATFALDRRVVFELAPDTEVELLELAEPGAARTIELRLRSGSLRVATREGFAPSGMLVHAPDCDVRIVGTEFGIDVFPGEATCVCCTEGVVEVELADGHATRLSVPAGGNAWCPAGGAPAMTGPVKPMHATPIEALRAHR